MMSSKQQLKQLIGKQVKLNERWHMSGELYIMGEYWPMIGAVGTVEQVDDSEFDVWARFPGHNGIWPVNQGEFDVVPSFYNRVFEEIRQQWWEREQAEIEIRNLKFGISH